MNSLSTVATQTQESVVPYTDDKAWLQLYTQEMKVLCGRAYLYGVSALAD